MTMRAALAVDVPADVAAIDWARFSPDAAALDVPVLAPSNTGGVALVINVAVDVPADDPASA
jgi:hypothetical protein